METSRFLQRKLFRLGSDTAHILFYFKYLQGDSEKQYDVRDQSRIEAS